MIKLIKILIKTYDIDFFFIFYWLDINNNYFLMQYKINIFFHIEVKWDII